MSSAGQQLVAGRIPGERIATTVVTTDSATFTTTEILVLSVTPPLVTGRIYRVRAVPRFGRTGGGATDVVVYRLREDNELGTERTAGQLELRNSGVAGNIATPLEFEYTATVTGNKSFALTGDVITGTATSHLEAASNRPAYLYVDFIR